MNDVIRSINGCQVRDKQDWKRCLVRSIRNPATGYCLTPQFIEEERFFSLDPDADCCGEDENKRNLCFESGSRNKFCFPGRILLKQFGSATCTDLNLHSLTEENGVNRTSTFCSPDRCFRPYSPHSNSTKLLVMEREDTDDFLFWGFPGELFSQITVSTFKPRSSWIPPSIILHFIDSFLR